MSIDQVIDERQHTHGDFKRQGAFANQLKRLLVTTPNFEDMPGHQQEALEMICTKISRILHGDASHTDSWRDIAGYALLGEG